MKKKHTQHSPIFLEFERFFDSLLVHLAVHDLKLKQQPKTRSDEPVIEFVEWVR